MKVNNCVNCGSQLTGTTCEYCRTTYTIDQPINNFVNHSIDIQRMEVQVQQARIATEYMALDQKTRNLTTAIENAKKDLVGKGKVGCLLIFFGLFGGPVGWLLVVPLGAYLLHKCRSPRRKVIKTLLAELETTKQRLVQLGF